MFKLKPLPTWVAALAIGALLPMSALAQDKEPVQIGLLTSISGVFSENGSEVQRAVQFAIDEANEKGGVGGRPVKVEVADDESTPETGRRAGEKLARDGYNLLVGTIASSISLAVAPSLDRWDAMLVTALSKSNKITGDSCKPRMFRATQSDAMDIAMINEWVKSFKEKTYASIAADYVWGHDSSDSFAKAVKGEGKDVKLALFVPMGSKDFSPYIAQLKAADVDAIWVAEVGRDILGFVKQAQEFGLIPHTKLIGHALILNAVVNGTGDALLGTDGTALYAPEIDTPLNKVFVASWKAKFGRLPMDIEALSYNAVQLVFEGVKRSGSVKPADVAAALRGATLDTIFGSVVMRAEDNQLMMPSYVARVETVDGVVRPVIEQTFPPSLIPPPSPLCKM
jgi:branched-chain amino acid transport system substrate-binding protein